MSVIHKDLAAGRWNKLSLVEQLANIGTDIARTISWKKRGDFLSSQQAFERALDLLDLTVADPKNRFRLKEPLRVREMLIDYFVYDNEYSTTEEFWQNYFYDFNYSAALARGK